MQPRPKRLIYLPIEPYDSRYTEYVSVPGGMFERCANALGVEVHSIRPDPYVRSISVGQVLDPVKRSHWAFQQTDVLQQLIVRGEYKPETDVIYIEDFWHPGFEMIPYTMDLLNSWFPIYSFCHAQSVDPNDFTERMAWWMRGFEQAWAQVQEGIFVAAPELKQMLLAGRVAPHRKVHSTGTVWNSQYLRERYDIELDDILDKEKIVVFSSRWDVEKQPTVFCSLADLVLSDRSDIKFIVCTGNAKLKSNEPALLERAKQMQNRYGSRFQVCEGLSKQQYFDILKSAKVQFNCALQDFVSYTLLEATLCRCAPLYPKYLTFPAALHNDPAHLYDPGDFSQMQEKLYALIDGPVNDYRWVYEKYEYSVHRMLQAMHFDVPPIKILPTLLEELGQR